MPHDKFGLPLGVGDRVRVGAVSGRTVSEQEGLVGEVVGLVPGMCAAWVKSGDVVTVEWTKSLEIMS